MRRQRRGQLARHETQFDEGPDAVLQQAIVDLVDVGPVVDRPTPRVLVVDAHFVVEYGMETDILNAGRLAHHSQIAAKAFAEREDRTARPEHLLPEVWEGMDGRLCVQRDLFNAVRGRLPAERKRKRPNAD